MVIQRRIENETAGTGVIVLAIVLAVIMVATIISLCLYVRHLRRKLANLSNSDEEISGIELDRPLNQQNNIDSKNVDGESERGANNL